MPCMRRHQEMVTKGPAGADDAAIGATGPQGPAGMRTLCYRQQDQQGRQMCYRQQDHEGPLQMATEQQVDGYPLTGKDWKCCN